MHIRLLIDRCEQVLLDRLDRVNEQSLMHKSPVLWHNYIPCIDSHVIGPQIANIVQENCNLFQNGRTFAGSRSEIERREETIKK